MKKSSIHIKQQSRMKKPFKPTNIPSPVYGFNQKPSVKKDVPKKPSETLNEPDKSVKEKVTLLSEEIERERGYPASDTQAHSKKKVLSSGYPI